MTRQSRIEGEWGGSLRIGSRLRGYIIENVLGQGGYGIVYRCRHLELGTTVAIKEYLPNELAVRVDGRVRVRNHMIRHHFEDGLRRFKEEALRLVEFADHPNIVSCQDFFRLNGTAYSVMDYEVSLPLSKLLQVREARHRPFDENDLLAIVIPLLDGLKRLHDGGVIHRDIKPSNILIRFADGQPVLIDFGSAKHSVALHTKSYAPFTPGYAPPELHADGDLGPWTDIYGVGAIMWRMATAGDPSQPVRAEQRAIAILQGKDDPMPSARQLRDERHSGGCGFRTVVLEAIDKCLTINPGDREQNCEDLIRHLQLEEGTARSCTNSTRSVMLGTQLHYAAWSGESKKIAELVESGVDVDATDEDSKTALHWAAEAGDAETLEQLLTSGCDPDAICGESDTALHVAVRYGHCECIKALISGGIDLRFISWIDHRHNGQTPVHLAVLHGHPKCVEALISGGVEWCEEDFNQQTPLDIAAETGSLSCVNVLCRAGGDNSYDEFSNALLVAMKHGQTECIQPLVDAVVRAGSFVGPITPWLASQQLWENFDYDEMLTRNNALFKAYVNAFATLIDAREGLLTTAYESGCIDSLVRAGLEFDRKWSDSALLDAASDGKPGYVGALLKAGIPVDVTDERGLSALLLAAKHGHSHCIEVICEEGACQADGIDVDAIDEQGRGALLLAAKHGYHDCVRALCHEGVGVTNEQNRSALLLAAKHGYWDCVQALCDAGTRIGFHNYAVQSVLHCALYVAHEVDWPRLMDWLRKSGADINMKDEYGRTALHIAAVLGHMECVSALLQAGRIDVDANDEQGRSAVLLAAQHGHWDCVQALCDAGATIAFHSYSTQTVIRRALHVADESKRSRLIDWLVRHGAHSNALSS